MTVTRPKRIIWHWTAGRGVPSALDREHYHFLIDHLGEIHDGDLPPEANNSTATAYAAHTRGTNTGAIGVGLCGMLGAQERPFSPGKHPLTEAQVEALATLSARLAERYGIPVRRDTMLSHAEVQPTLGVTQRGKWDIAWLPGMDAPGDPVEVGDRLRAMVRSAQQRPHVDDDAPPAPRSAPLRVTDTETLQRALAALDTAPGPADGLWGPKTMGALRALLMRLGVTQIGPADNAASYAVVQAALTLKGA